MDSIDINSKDFVVVSHNTTGWGKHKSEFILTLGELLKAKVIGIQEHMLLKPNLYKLTGVFKEYEAFPIEAVKSTENLNQGRPSGGIALLWRKELNKYVTPLTSLKSSRVQGILLSINNTKLLIINSYFPTDPRVDIFDEWELQSALQDIRFLRENTPHNHCVLMGDINTDFTRTTRFVDIIKQFTEEQSMLPVWNTHPIDYTYMCTQERNGRLQSYFSTIDHFLTDPLLIPACKGADVIHLGDNLSNHQPVYINLSIKDLPEPTTQNNRPNDPRPMWHRAEDHHLHKYVSELCNNLNTITIDDEILNCQDVHCNDPHHRELSDNYCMDVLDSISRAVGNNIPISAPSKRKNVIPGWNEDVKKSQDDARFWHAVWRSAGKPMNTELHRLMKYTRNQFHYAVRRVKRKESEIRNNKFIKCCLENNVDDLLGEIKKMRGCHSNNSEVIDGKSGEKDISHHFRELYEALYTSVESTGNLNDLINDIDSDIHQDSMQYVNNISAELIKLCIDKLKKSKSDVEYNWGSDALIYGGDVLAESLALMFRIFITHGHISKFLLLCSLVPIVKDPLGDKTSSANYRAIAISSLFMKIFDWIILILCGDKLAPNQYQYGFMKNSSTVMCSWVVLETINYFTNRNTPVYCCLLDLTKAFDNVDFFAMFNKLRSRIPAIFLRVIINSYLNQACQVKWSSTKSTYFKVTNGVRQGAVASPIFFNIYLDDVFLLMDKSGLGCRISEYFYGLHGYADDCVLLSPDRGGLQKMLDICKNYFDVNKITISTNIIASKSKTKCILFGSRNETPFPIILEGRSLPWVDNWPHLGNLLSKDESMHHDMLRKRGQFIGKLHSMKQEFGSIDPLVHMKLVKIYLTSFYGSNLWDLYDNNVQHLYSTWNVMVRMSFDLPRETHRYLISPISRSFHLKDILVRRFVKFYNTLSNSEKPSVTYLKSVQEHDLRSTFGRNVHNIFKDADVSSMSNVKTTSYMPLLTQEHWRINAILELLECQAGRCSVGLDSQQVRELLGYLATS